jgi:hypothetical protein
MFQISLLKYINHIIRAYKSQKIEIHVENFNRKTTILTVNLIEIISSFYQERKSFFMNE